MNIQVNINRSVYERLTYDILVKDNYSYLSLSYCQLLGVVTIRIFSYEKLSGSIRSSMF